MKQLILSINEEETLKDLLEEEIEVSKNNENCEEYKKILNCIKVKLQDKKLSEEIRLGLKIGRLKDTYGFKDIYNFITGKKNECFYFVDLKPLYDEFGYQKVNEVILAVGNEMFEVKENE